MHMGDKHLDEDKIRERAYLIWEREGRPHGQHDQHWNQARWELLSEQETATPAGAGKSTAKKAPRKAATRAKAPAAKATDGAAKPKATKPRATKPKAVATAKPAAETKTARPTKRSTGAGKAD